MSPLIYASCRDCPTYFASAETVRDLLLPAETVVIDSYRDCTRDLASCRESRQEAESHGQSIQEAIFRGR